MFSVCGGNMYKTFADGIEKDSEEYQTRKKIIKALDLQMENLDDKTLAEFENKIEDIINSHNTILTKQDSFIVSLHQNMQDSINLFLDNYKDPEIIGKLYFDIVTSYDNIINNKQEILSSLRDNPFLKKYGFKSEMEVYDLIKKQALQIAFSFLQMMK